MTSSANSLRGRSDKAGDGSTNRGLDSSADRAQLARGLAEFAATSIQAGHAVLLAVSPETQRAMLSAFRERYFAADAAESEGALAWIDAEEIVRRAKDGHGGRDDVRARLSGVVQQIRATRKLSTVRVWEESSALLRDAGLRAHVVELWSELARRERLDLISLRDVPGLEPSSAHESGQRLSYPAAVLARAQSEERAEGAGRTERENLQKLLMQSPALIVITKGPDHVAEFVNSAAARLLGGEDLVGKPLREVLSEREDRIQAIDHVYRSGERYVADNLSSVRDWNGNGCASERFFNVVYEPYRGPSAAIEGVMLFGFEVTEQVLANRKIESIVKELEVANRTKDEFLATVSHELRTPLNAILGWVKMLRSGSLSEDKRERALETIDRNASAQAQLIEDLLDVSRIISGKLRLDVRAVDVATVVEEALDSVRPAAAAKSVMLRRTLDPDAGPILGDPDRLRQVVWNLLTNAVKFTPKGGSVHVSLHKRDSAVHITVTDTGQGIPREFVDHVFEQFRQADSTTTRKHGGLGLGLTIVRSLVELHGGSVSAHSDGPGKGASFAVSLPISPVRSSSFERPPALSLVRTSEFRPQNELAGVHVLVVDDEDDARNLLAEILSEAGARVSTASSVASAMDFIARERPEVIVSDIGMPGQDGYDFIRQLRALPASAGGRTPAVALTAYCRVEDRTKALAAGFNMHATKPVEPTELIAGLASLAALFERP
jgi:signal transduction histidine kinase/ActR/RegA family two-component response regulator